MAPDSLLANRFLRHTLAVALAVVIGLISYNFLLTVPSFATLLIEATEHDAVRLSRHLESYLLLSEQRAMTKDSLNLQLLSEVDRLKHDFELMNLKVFSPAGEILFSGDEQEVGTVNQRRYFTDVVAKGRIYAEVVPRNTESLEGRKVSSDVLETYVPLMKDGRFLGALEIYYDITDRKQELDRLIWRSSAITLTFASGLLVAIIVMLYQENTAMKKRRQLEEERLQRGRLEGVMEMAGAACHELNQPLQTILSYSQLLSKRVTAESPLCRDIEEIRSAIDQLRTMVNKLMHITRYETKEYVKGTRIIDIDRASSLESPHS